MVRSTSQHRTKWALAMRREMQMAIEQQLRTESGTPEELPPALTALLKSDDPYVDIVGTC